ncbi:hypothetical protein BC826DRAFT_1103767 [Russula brevipes]|nr:hypothetical protein BC826DRAFT_1103767 [Russula brevipes]
MSTSLSLPVELLEYVIEWAVAVPDLRNALPSQYTLYPEHALPLHEIKLSAATLFSLTLRHYCTPSKIHGQQRPSQNDIERLVHRVVRRFGTLERLARYLPHIQILSISIFTQELFGLPLPYYGKNFATVITETCAQSLRELHLHRNPLVLFSRQELRKLLQSTPNSSLLLTQAPVVVSVVRLPSPTSRSSNI